MLFLQDFLRGQRTQNSTVSIPIHPCNPLRIRGVKQIREDPLNQRSIRGLSPPIPTSPFLHIRVNLCASVAG